MTDYGATDTSTTTLGANQFPISEVYVPNTGLRALEGGPVATDGSSKTSAPAGVTLLLRAALSPYGSNPSQTAAAGADTLYKFGSGGTTSFNHCSIQNNTGAALFYAFDQSTTTSGNQVYVLANGQAAQWDRAGTVLHFSSAAQQNFGGQTGITVEAFA